MPDDTPLLLVTLDANRLPEPALDLIRETASGYDVVRAPDDPAEHLDRAEVVLGWLAPEAVARAPQLRWIQSWSAGVDWLIGADADLPQGLRVTSASGVHPVPISEHVFAALLAFARRLPLHLRAQQERQWRVGMTEGVFELAGRRMVLLGVGEIGGRIARLADAFGMFVTAVRHHPEADDTEGVARTVGTDRLLDVLPEADVLVVTLPLTDATRGLVGAGALSALPEHAVLVNVGRGEVVDQAALVAALQTGQIAAAALDVFEEEPLPEDSPLWTMDNVIITPHAAGDTPHYADRALGIFLDNWGRYRRGEPLLHAVDLGAGY